MLRMFLTSTGLSILMASIGIAGEADVVDVSVAKGSGGTFSFSVTLQHADEGWEHYADAWEVVNRDGTKYGTRVLAHPHVNEQPFTRSKSGVRIPADIKSVTIRAHDKVHGYGGKTMEVNLPGR